MNFSEEHKKKPVIHTDKEVKHVVFIFVPNYLYITYIYLKTAGDLRTHVFVSSAMRHETHNMHE